MLDSLIDEFVAYLANVKNYSPRTLPSYRSSLHRFFREAEITDINQITPQKVEKYLEDRKSQGISQNTNATFMNALRALLIFSNKRGYANHQIEMFEVPRRKRTRIEFVTPEEVSAMVDTLKRERDRLMLLVLFTSGCRVSELIQITMENLQGNRFSIMAKGGKPHVYYFDLAVAERLNMYLMMEGITQGPIFTTTTGKPVGTPCITHIVRKAAKDANITHHVHPHQFRHGFATSALEAGADIRTIQEMMGHENIQTTIRYTHVTDNRMKETHNRFAPKVQTVDYLTRLQQMRQFQA
jgi:site-specific recombinase XerD